MDDDVPKKPARAITVGENLDTISIAELTDRIQALEEEIRRVKSEIDRKTASKAKADAFFKS